MTYTNSSLVTYKKLSPNYNSRPTGQKITNIVIHYMAGNLTVEGCGSVFAPVSRQASSNYGIGSDGRIGMYVEEKNRSWCSSSATIDNKAVTIECANIDSYGTLTDKAMKSLIKLCADICKRNGIKKCTYTGDKSGTLHMHCWYASTSCPGQYLKGKFKYIADEVNKLLNADTKTTTTAKPTTTTTKTATTKTNTFKSYKVKVTCNVLNVRKGASVIYDIVTTVKKNEVYTIVGENKNWGKLKSGAGWICLDYTKKVK